MILPLRHDDHEYRMGVELVVEWWKSKWVTLV